MGSADAAVSLGEFAVHALGRDAQGRLNEPGLRSRLASFEIDEAAFAAWLEQTRDQAHQGVLHPAVSSAIKFYGAELNKRRFELMMAVQGADALEWQGARSGEGALARSWLRSKGNSIEGGTSEVMLNVVAKRILELPGA